MVFLTNRHLIFVLITYLIILRTSLSLEHSVNGDVPFLPKHVMITNKLVTRERNGLALQEQRERFRL